MWVTNFKMWVIKTSKREWYNNFKWQTNNQFFIYLFITFVSSLLRSDEKASFFFCLSHLSHRSALCLLFFFWSLWYNNFKWQTNNQFFIYLFITFVSSLRRSDEKASFIFFIFLSHLSHRSALCLLFFRQKLRRDVHAVPICESICILAL